MAEWWAFWRRFPNRRRRFWKYVSPRRRGTGVMLLALILLLVSGYWYLTNDRRIRRQAEDYLQSLTGGRVKIGQAHFSLFRGIELTQVKLSVPGDASPYPLFQAGTIILKYSPWDLFIHRKLLPLEIVCADPVVTLEHDVESDQYNAVRMYAMSEQRRTGAAFGWTEPLPPMRVQGAKVRIAEKAGDLRQVRGERRLNLHFSPGRDGTYVIRMEEDRGGGQVLLEQGRITFNLATGQYRLEGTTFFQGLDEVLPEKFSRLRRDYRIDGRVEVKARGASASAIAALDARLMGVSLTLPKEQGGLVLQDVKGTLSCDANGVTLKDVTGRIRQGGAGEFELTGRWNGYGLTSPFDIRLKVRHLTLPEPNSTQGELAGLLEYLRRDYALTGPLSLEANASRDARGKLRYDGTLQLEGVSLTCKWFPYRLDDLKGRLRLQDDRVELDGVTARHDRSEIAIAGWFKSLTGQPVFDLTFDSNDVAVCPHLQKALPPEVQAIYRDLKPEGTVRAHVRLFRRPTDTVEHVEADILPDGNASICFVRFPYRLEKLVGEVRLANDTATIKSLRGSHGPMSCTIDGEARDISTDRSPLHLRIAAQSVPLDEDLIHAFGPRTQGLIRAVHPSGLAATVTADVWQIGSGEPNYDVHVVLKDANIRVDALPYAVSGASGTLRVTPGRVAIERITGRHGPATITLQDSSVYLSEDVGLDLHVMASDLRLDKELHEALPASVKRTWERLRPGGTADVKLAYQEGIAPGAARYRLEVTARDMEATLQDFPVRLRGIRGQITVTPECVQLANVTARDGNMTAWADGNVVFQGATERVRLRLQARDVPITKEFLAALPEELAHVAQRFQEGGTCDANVAMLEIVRSTDDAATRPGAGAVASSSATTRPALRTLSWAGEGQVSLRDAIGDLGLGGSLQTLTGSVGGSASRSEAGFQVDARADLSCVLVGRQKVTELSGTLRKTAKGPAIHIRDFQAKALGGHLTGSGKVELGDTITYGLNITVDDIRLPELLKDAAADPNAKTDIEGLVSGNIRISGVAGQPDKREGGGRLRMTEGKLGKLPIILGFLQVITLTPPSKAAFTEADIEYELKGSLVTFQEIYLRSTALSAVGSGKVTIKTDPSGNLDLSASKLNLNFLTGPPKRLQGRSALEELLHGIAGEISQVQITGYLSNPDVRQVTLPSLNEFINKVLNPGAEKD